MSRFDISLKNGDKISGEYKAGKHVVIFSHGFDVRRDSNGLFHDLAGALPEDFGFVLFDYHAHEGPTETLRPLSEQSRVLEHVITWTGSQLKPLSLHLVAHSMGCTVAALNGNISFDSVTFLAPPLRTGGGLRRFFTSHPEAIHYDEYWEIQRRSGKITRVSEAFFRDLETANPEAFIRAYASHVPLSLVVALHDKYISGSHYEALRRHKNIEITVLDADHNFTGAGRQIAADFLKERLAFKRTA